MHLAMFSSRGEGKGAKVILKENRDRAAKMVMFRLMIANASHKTTHR